MIFEMEHGVGAGFGFAQRHLGRLDRERPRPACRLQRPVKDDHVKLDGEFLDTRNLNSEYDPIAAYVPIPCSL
jgi:hypothetical protein